MSVRLENAKLYCAEAHAGQVRKYTGEPYHVHPFEVMDILAGVGADEDTLIAGLLHDVIEDTDVTHSNIKAMFGRAVADLVVEVTDVSRPEDGNRKLRKVLDRDHLAKSSPAGASIKLADIISNTASIVERDPSFAPVYLREKRELLTVLGHGNDALWARAAKGQLAPKHLTNI